MQLVGNGLKDASVYFRIRVFFQKKKPDSQTLFYRSSVNQVAPPRLYGGGTFTYPLGVILEYQTEMFTVPPLVQTGGCNLIY